MSQLTKQEISDLQSQASTELIGPSWDGSNKYKPELEEDLEISLSTSTKIAGILTIEGNDSHTLVINGINVPINDEGPTEVGWHKVNGKYYAIDKDGKTVLLNNLDEISPTVASATIIDANTIRVVFDKIMGVVTVAGHSFERSAVEIIPDSVSGAGYEWDFVVSETLLNSDILTYDYDSSTGNTLDTAAVPNELGSFTDEEVINAIGGETDITAMLQNISQAGTVYTGTGGGGFTDNLGYAVQTITGDGEFIIDIPDKTKEILIGFQGITGFWPYNAWEHCIFNFGSGGVYGYQSGGGVFSGYGITNGDRLKLKRVGTTVTFERYNSGIWTVGHTFAASSTGTLYLHFAVSNGHPITNPKILLP
jgi:hypothetical protein